MNKWMRKVLAVVEVFFFVLLVVPFLVLTTYRFFPQFEVWQTEKAGFVFPVYVDIVMILVAIGMILGRRKKLVEYGLDFRNIRYQLDIAGMCFIPVVIASFPLGMGVNYKSGGGALILTSVQVGLLFFLGWILRNKPTMGQTGMALLGLFLLPQAAGAQGVSIGKVAAVFLTYVLFVGFGEEILYRGYVQSRLNEVFSKRYRFFGVAFGWGAILTAILFGITHTGIVSYLRGAVDTLTLAWGFWTIFGGLVFGFVREKTGGILAPALLHGLPQAIASVAMLFFLT